MDKRTIRPKWRSAKTYARFAPHEYFLQKENPAAFLFYKDLLDKEGVDEPFTLYGHIKWYRYYYTDTHRYWIDEGYKDKETGEYPLILNRDSRFGKKSEWYATRKINGGKTNPTLMV